jgi:NADH-quinone oxidoreductase subunit G
VNREEPSQSFFQINNIRYNYFTKFQIAPRNEYYIKEYNKINSTTRSAIDTSWSQTVSLLDYCLNLGIFVPHFCYHKHLSIAGNCRMCLVELKKSPKPIVSCAMNAKAALLGANTEIYTNSPLVKKARENILEFLLLNHPLDCPICDQGGECDLQDQSLFFGLTKKRFYNYKRIVTDKDLGLVVKTVMTRCIHCTRCVRFGDEIAGDPLIRMLGRGINSEIGTYVNQIFLSELSGNIADLCPVGALTLKPYPFTGRNWELIKIQTVDLTDGYCSNIHVFLKNNKIIKILSRLEHFSTDNPTLWISDKTRFIFDSIFSSNGYINKVASEIKASLEEISWTTIFNKLVNIIYILDHLQTYNRKINKFVLIFDENSSMENLCLLLLLEKKYSFFHVRRSVKIKHLNDFQSDYKINALRNSYLLSTSDACLLLGTNIRYENPYYHLKLKRRFNLGDFIPFVMNPVNYMSFPSIQIGINLEELGFLTEGNSNYGLGFAYLDNLLTITNMELLIRQDSFGILKIFQKLTTFCSEETWSIFNFNVLNNSMNSVGIQNLQNFKSISIYDFIKSNGIFLINNSLKISDTLKKFTELSFFGFINVTITSKFLVEQNYKNYITDLKNKDYTFDYFYLQSSTFFESSGNYINTEGEVKNTTKLIATTSNSKEDWEILRKLYYFLNTLTFSATPKSNTKIHFDNNNLFNFKILMSLLYINTRSLSKFSFYKRAFNQVFNNPIRIQKLKKLKLLLSQFKIWIEDFFIGGSDNYSTNSQMMTLLSMAFRTEIRTFAS